MATELAEVHAQARRTLLHPEREGEGDRADDRGERRAVRDPIRGSVDGGSRASFFVSCVCSPRALKPAPLGSRS